MDELPADVLNLLPPKQSVFIVNSIFPIKLGEISTKKKMKYIHITTNCVFSGNKGLYIESDIHDAEELYGISKSLGENISDACILRTSIIGEELFNKVSLLEWVKSNKNGNIKGYTNFYWNGVTCLTLANIILDIIKNNIYWKGIRHIYSPNIINKYELCQIINKVYKLNINIESYSLKEEKNMTLSSIYIDNPCILNNIYPIEQQIQELYDNHHL